MDIVCDGYDPGKIIQRTTSHRNTFNAGISKIIQTTTVDSSSMRKRILLKEASGIAETEDSWVSTTDRKIVTSTQVHNTVAAEEPDGPPRKNTWQECQVRAHASLPALSVEFHAFKSVQIRSAHSYLREDTKANMSVHNYYTLVINFPGALEASFIYLGQCESSPNTVE